MEKVTKSCDQCGEKIPDIPTDGGETCYTVQELNSFPVGRPVHYVWSPAVMAKHFCTAFCLYRFAGGNDKI